MNFLKDLNSRNATAGSVSALLAITGPPAIILEAAANGHFTPEQTILWMFSVYVVGGIFSIVVPICFRMPIAGAHSITAVTFLATVSAQFTYPQLIGTYVISSLLMLLIGVLGIFSKLLDFVPKPVIAVMLAGMIIKYMVGFIISASQLPLIGGVSLAVFLALSKWKTRIPPMVGAVAAGVVLLALTHSLPSATTELAFVLTSLQLPEFDALSFLSVSLPLALLVLSNDAAVGIAALEQKDFRPPTNRIIALCGGFSLLTSFLGGQSANMAGMMSAICSDDEAGPKDKRYMAAVVSGVIILIFGLFSWKLVPLIQGMPKAFSMLLVGFALLGVFGNSLVTGFSNPRMKLSTAITFVVAISNLTILNISAPVWSLLAGTLIARYVEEAQLEQV